MWHHFASFYLLSPVVFSCPHLKHSHHTPCWFFLLFSSLHLFFLPPVIPFPLSLFCLTTPLFDHFSSVCLKWPHLPPLILFLPHLSSPCSSLTLSFITLICPSLLSFVFKFNNFFTPFIYSSSFDFTFSNYSSFHHPPISKYLSAFTLGIWHPFTLSSDSIFILFKCVYHILTSCLRSLSPPLFYYLLNWSHFSFSSTEI